MYCFTETVLYSFFIYTSGVASSQDFIIICPKSEPNIACKGHTVIATNSKFGLAAKKSLLNESATLMHTNYSLFAGFF